jgi:hypothetical protein
MAVKIPGANTTAQWYGPPKYTGSWFNHLEKSLKHTTETRGWPGYGGGASMPNATYHPLLRAIRQHTWADISSRALQDPTGTTVRENRDFVFQLEIVCYSDKALAASVGGLWVGNLTDAHMEDIARIDLFLHQRLGLPLTTGVTWTPGKASPTPSVRLSGPQYDAARGIIGHMHASGNSHWDPGGFDINRYFRALARIQPPPEEDDDMPTVPEIWEIKRWAEYEDEDGDGVRDYRSPIDMLFATHKFAVRAERQSRENAEALARIEAKLGLPTP